MTQRRAYVLRSWVLCGGLFYLALRLSYQPLLDKQDVLPLIPMLMPFVAALLFVLRDRLPAAGVAATVAAIAAETLVTLHGSRPWRGELRTFDTQLETLLRLARPQEFVMDDKAESIFRPRPLYWVLENVTRYRLRTGSIPDDLIARLAADHVAVGVFARETGHDRDFIAANYVPIGANVEVLGQRFAEMSAAVDFDIDVAIAGRYAIMQRGGGEAEGLLDGTRYDAPRVLAEGRHHFQPARSGEWALIWARAYELGYSPFLAETDALRATRACARTAPASAFKTPCAIPP